MRNATPILGTAYCPFNIMVGRPTIFEEQRVKHLMHLSASSDQLNSTSLMELFDLRNQIARADARKTIGTSLAKNLRSNMTWTYRYNDKVQILYKGKWGGTYRVLAYSGGSDLILDRAGSLLKFPTALVRPLYEESNLSPPPLEDDDVDNPPTEQNPRLPPVDNRKNGSTAASTRTSLKL